MSKKRIHQGLVDSENQKHAPNHRSVGNIDSRPAEGPRDYLNEPEIHIYKNRVYDNGRQQALVRIQFQIISGGEVRPMSARERSSIRLFKHGSSANPEALPTDGIIPLRPGDDPSLEGWTAQMSDNGFLPHPAATPQGPFPWPKTEEEQGEIVDLFIACEATPAMHPMPIAFQIKLDNGRIFRTDGYVYEQVGGWSEYNGEMDTGFGHVIHVERSERYTSADYLMVPRDVDDEAADANIYTEVTIQPLSNKPSVGIHSVQAASPNGAMHYKDTRPNTSNPCFTAYIPPHDLRIHHNETIFDRLSKKTEIPLTGPNETGRVLTLVFLLRSGLPREQDGDLPGGRVSFTVIDMFGSQQLIHYEFIDGTRAKIRFV